MDIQWISGTILGQCQPLGMLKYLNVVHSAIPTLVLVLVLVLVLAIFFEEIVDF